MLNLRFAVLVLLGGCVVNGRSFGPGSSTNPPPQPASTAPATGAPTDDLYTADGRVREDARYYKEPPYLSAPADPWAAVVGDQPLRWPETQASSWHVRGNAEQCTARRDHCLVKDTWFLVRQSLIDRKKEYSAVLIPAAATVFGPSGHAIPSNAISRVQTTTDAIAFRTVPATKQNLVPGALVIGLPHGGLPASGIEAVEAFWVYGELESIDYAAGVYQLKDYPDTMPLAGARVAVLVWKPGGKVEIIGNKRRNQLAVSASDVFLP